MIRNQVGQAKPLKKNSNKTKQSHPGYVLHIVKVKRSHSEIEKSTKK